MRPSRLVPVFYEAASDLFFLQFHRTADDDCEPELVIHVVTILDAREVLQDVLQENEEIAARDAAEHFVKTGLLTWNKVLPDNSCISWERHTAELSLVPDFRALAQALRTDAR